MCKEDILIIKSLLDKLSEKYNHLEEKYSSNLEKVKTFTECQAALKASQEENSLLKQKIELLEQNYKEFSKVSHVVALEKENAKLKSEVEKLKKSSLAPEVVVPPAPPLLPPLEEQEPSQSEEDEEFYEKKIKGVVYYVSSRTNKLYEKTPDDEVGPCVGNLEKEIKNNKTVTKVVWI